MQATATQAVLPKARGMYAKHISPVEYEEMLRRRTVPELAALLKRHPYFAGSLATLSVADPHRGQIEELLSMDIFAKYEALRRYDFSQDGFSAYYLDECEVREVLKALQLLSIGLPGTYLSQAPPYLVGKTHIDLLGLGRARSFEEVLGVCHGAFYHKTLRAQWLADPALTDFPMTEAALLRSGYASLFARIDAGLGGREAQSVRNLFLQQAEIYNLELMLRVKLYYPRVYPPKKLRLLLLPYRYHLKKSRLDEMVEAKTPEELLAIYRHSGAVNYTGTADPDELASAGGRRIYRFARRVMHLTASPMAALASFVTLAGLERENVVNVVEGVRYGLEPERIRVMLRF